MAEEEEISNVLDIEEMDIESPDVFLENNSLDVSIQGNGNDTGESVENGKWNSQSSGTTENKVLPRRSSLMKRSQQDRTDRNERALNRKKTVSFSIMPAEKKIATGK